VLGLDLGLFLGQTWAALGGGKSGGSIEFDEDPVEAGFSRRRLRPCAARFEPLGDAERQKTSVLLKTAVNPENRNYHHFTPVI
jgi:hypothetical protein